MVRRRSTDLLHDDLCRRPDGQPGRFEARQAKVQQYAVGGFDRLAEETNAMRLRAAFALAALAFGSSMSPAFAETWTLIIQPAPYSDNPPPYDSWIAYRQYSDLQTCLGMRMTLHYELWASDKDLSMRALAGVCRSDATGQIVKDYPGADDEDF
jgi:hypothetical protein